MKETMTLLIISVVCMTTLLAAEEIPTTEEILKEISPSITINAVQSKQETITIETLKNLPIIQAHKYVPESIKQTGGMYMVRGYFKTPQRRMAASLFLSNDFSTAVYGRGFNTSTATEYTMFDPSYAKENTIITYGSGPQEIYLVSDPHCPACKRIENDLEKFKDAATFYITLIALPQHPEAPDAIRYIASLEEEQRYKALVDIANGAKPYKDMNLSKEQKVTYNELIKKMELNADFFGVRGTPSLFDADGQPLNPNVLYRLQEAVKAP